MHEYTTTPMRLSRRNALRATMTLRCRPLIAEGGFLPCAFRHRSSQYRGCDVPTAVRCAASCSTRRV